MPYTFDSINNFIPEDLLINPTAEKIAANNALDKDVFTYTEPNLKIDSSYLFQFKYIFEDGSESDEWSPAYRLLTGTESVPAAPTATVTGGAGFIKVELSTFPANALRVDVRISGGTFGNGTVVAASFTSAGVKTISAQGAAGQGNQYFVTLLTVTPSKINGDPTSVTTVYVTDPAASVAVDPSTTPSTPTVSSVLGAIQLAWNGKTSSGGNQPNGFKAAKVYVGTASNFTPIDTGNSGANQVDVLNFGNGQNTLNISIGTVVNGVAMDYGIDYFVKIKTTNGNVAQDSSPVLAAGSPVRIGQVGDGDIIEVKFDKLRTGTLTSQILTVGAAAGKHVKLSGTGDPLTIYGTGGTSDPLLSFGTNNQNQSVLTIKGNGTFSGDISAASGTFTGNITSSGGLFSVNNGVLTAQSGTIGGWTITGSLLHSSTVSGGKIELNPATPKISLQQNGVDKITIDPVEGIVGPTKTVAGNTGPAFKLSPDGNAQFRGSIYADDGVFSGIITSTGSGAGGGEFGGSLLGTLTLSGGGISHSSMLSIYAPSLNATFSGGGDDAYLIISPDPSSNILALIGQGNATGDLQFRIMRSQGFTNFARGYHMIGLDDFLQSGINSAGTAYGTVVSAFGQLLRGRAFYYGSQSSSSGINGEALGAKIGDVYLSTN